MALTGDSILIASNVANEVPAQAIDRVPDLFGLPPPPAATEGRSVPWQGDDAGTGDGGPVAPRRRRRARRVGDLVGLEVDRFGLLRSPIPYLELEE